MLVLYAGSCSDTDLSTGTSPGPPLELLQVTICQALPQCWKMSGSASSTAARKCFTKCLRRKFLSSYTGMPYNLLIV